MSGKINGNGGLGEIFKRILANNSAPAEATPATESAPAPKVRGDVNLIGSNGGASRLSLTANVGKAEATSPTDLVRTSKDFNEFLLKSAFGSLPPVKLDAHQTAKLMSHLRDQLAARGFNEQTFAELKKQLG